jgi:hypothetical protein
MKKIYLMFFIFLIHQLSPQSTQDSNELSNISPKPIDLQKLPSEPKIQSPYGELKLYLGQFNGNIETSNSTNLSSVNLIYNNVLTQGFENKNNHYASQTGFKYFFNIKSINNKLLFGLDKINFNSSQKSLGAKPSSGSIFPTVSSYDSSIDLTDWNFGLEIKASNDFTLIPKYTIRQFSQKYYDTNLIGDPSNKEIYFKSLNEKSNAGILGLIGIYEINNNIKLHFDISLPLNSLNSIQSKATKYYSYNYVDIFDQYVSQTFTYTTIGNSQEAGFGSYDLKIDLSKSNRIKIGLEYEINEKVSIELSCYQEYISFQRKNVKVIDLYSYNYQFKSGDYSSITSYSAPYIYKSLINQNLNQNFFYQGLSFQIVIKIF